MRAVTRFVRRRAARAARAIAEAALDLAGWPWSLRLSRWLDALIILEEGRE
jgi:hypothetical protein